MISTGSRAVDTKDASSRKTSARGEHRRQLLLDAAAELIMERGFAGVSHRTVAQHAGLPLASTTYYFDSLDELIAGAVHRLAEGWLDDARREARESSRHHLGSRALTEALIRVAAPMPSPADAYRATLLSLYERYVEAARQTHLQPVIAEYDAQIEALLAETLRANVNPNQDLAGAGRLLLAVIDGALLRALAEGVDLESATTAVQCLVQSLTEPRADGGPLPLATDKHDATEGRTRDSIN